MNSRIIVGINIRILTFFVRHRRDGSGKYGERKPIKGVIHTNFVLAASGLKRSS